MRESMTRTFSPPESTLTGLYTSSPEKSRRPRPPTGEPAHGRFQLFGRILGEPLHHVEVAAVEILAVVLGEVVGGDGNAPLEAAAVGLDFLREDAEEGSLCLFVRADKGDFLPLGDDEGHILEQLHAVLRLPHDFKTLCAADHHAFDAPHIGIIVRDDHADWCLHWTFTS